MAPSKIERAAQAHERRGAHLPYLPALDGLRALAVVAVLLYHAGVYVPGGFLGVESFFVLSGFLITSLLLVEWRRDGRIDLRAFWVRRARRLLPALFLVLGGTLAFALLALPAETAELTGDALAALAYVMNWHLVLGQRSYFDPALRPPLLQHLWSLAVEEQFYLAWPVLFACGMRALRLRGMLLATLAGGAASLALMASLFEPGADPSRVYYGTDTRAAGLLLGAALALVWWPDRAPAAGSRVAGAALDIAGVAGLAVLTAAYLWLFEQHPLLYRGGFALVAAATALVIAAATHPRARLLPWLLGLAPLRWVGVRSYGIYLWHWPVLMLSRPGVDVPLEGPPLLALQFGLVLALAALSYRYVETPIRRKGIAAVWRELRAAFAASARSTHRPRVASYYSRGDRSVHPFSPRWKPLPLAAALLLFAAACVAPASPQPGATDAPSAVPTLVAAAAATPAPTAAEVPVARTVAAETAAQADTPTATAEPTPIPATPTAAPTDTPLPEPTAVPLAPFDPELAEALQRVLDETVADGHIPGASVAVQIPGYELWAGASGVSDRQTGAPMTPETRVRIASISKVFTAALVLRLAEEGVIDLDAPMTTWLPDLVPNGDAITVRHLLQHTTGLYDFLEDRNFVSLAYRTPDRVFEPAELVAYATQFPPAFRVGTEGAWDYSSTNYVILGMIVEQATGNSMAREMRARIFEPLGLENTFFTPDEPIIGEMSRGYSRTTDQTQVAMSFAFATANLVSTPSDVQRFGAALFGGELLSPESMEQMLTFVDGKGQYNMPQLAYGLGVMRNVLPVGNGPDGQPRPAEASTVLGHIGGFGGFRSALWHAPESGITVALGVNQASTDPNILATRVYDAILTHQGR